MRDQAIYNLYPQVRTIIDGITCLDSAGVKVVIDEALITPELANLVFAAARVNKLKYINAEADKRFEVMLAPYPQYEVNTWSNQYAEAKALKLDPLAYTPTLTALALYYGVAVSILAQGVLTKAAAYTTASGEIIGRRKKLTDQLGAATTVTQIEAVIWI